MATNIPHLHGFMLAVSWQQYADGGGTTTAAIEEPDNV